MIEMSRRRFLAKLAASALVAPATARIPSIALANEHVFLPDLERGGFVIYFRHGATTWSGVDRLEWPREQQRLLSDEGIRQSEVIGRAFRAREIPVGEVLASPFARCRDMAEIAFGRVEERMELVGLLSDADGREARVDYLQRKVTEAPRDGKNRIIISHTSNIAAVADVRLEEGEAVILRPNGLGGFDIMGTANPDDWLP